jgi:DNA binding domain, excisionase family
MLIELDDRDIERVAIKVTELLKPLLKSSHQRNEQEEIILDVDGLASYLKVNKSWVYEKTHLNEIPYYKVGKFPRFKKKEIDRWLDRSKINPEPFPELAERERRVMHG